jgi:hypothetical protein
VPCQSHPPWLDHSNYTWRRVQVIKLPLWSFLQPPTLHPSSVNIFSSAPYPQTPSVCVPSLVSKTKFHTYKTTGKITVFSL